MQVPPSQFRHLHPKEGRNPGIHLHEEDETGQQEEQPKDHQLGDQLRRPGGVASGSGSTYQSNFDLFADLSFKVDNSPGIVKHLAQTLGLMGVAEGKKEEERGKEEEEEEEERKRKGARRGFVHLRPPRDRRRGKNSTGGGAGRPKSMAWVTYRTSETATCLV